MLIETPNELEWFIPELDDHTSKVEIKVDGRIHLVPKAVAKLFDKFDNKVNWYKKEIAQLEKSLKIKNELVKELRNQSH